MEWTTTSHRALGARAVRDKRSISQEAVKIVGDSLAAPEPVGSSAADPLLELAGAWDDERDPKTIAEEIRQDRRDSQRFEAPADVSA
ncbi:MAG TPA: antitoxin [Sumerlaeia bacterium]|nr:antitoxin [Sumerlaeia bacterium]